MDSGELEQEKAFPGFVCDSRDKCDNKNNHQKLDLKFQVVLELEALKQGVNMRGL